MFRFRKAKRKVQVQHDAPKGVTREEMLSLFADVLDRPAPLKLQACKARGRSEMPRHVRGLQACA